MRAEPQPIDPAAVSTVVVILSASRGCSSLLFQLLRGSGRFVCLQGEHTHLYRLFGLGLPDRADAHDGDADANRAGECGFVRAYLDECSVGDVDRIWSVDRYAVEVSRHLVQQWPALACDAATLHDLVTCHVHVHAGRAGPFDAVELLGDVLADLRARGADVDPWYYDVPGERVRLRFPDLPAPGGPPHPTAGGLIEEPPFIVPRPTRPAACDALPARPLLLKASTDAYRGALLRRLFPAAGFRIVHMVRNPAASINGLYEGWLSRGFFSHDLGDRVSLDIEGYSHAPWGDTWWKFDLPPGWREMTAATLPRVCAFQWRQAHGHILSAIEAWDAPTLRLRAEDLTAGGERRRRAVAEALAFAGALGRGRGRAGEGDPVVMATSPPRPRRWLDRAAMVSGALDDEAVRDMACRLGYGREPSAGWT